MDGVKQIETKLNELIDRHQYGISSADLILYIHMHNQLAETQDLEAILEQVRSDLTDHLTHNHPVLPWNLVCMGWLLSDDTLSSSPDNSHNLLNVIDEQLMRYGDTTLKNGQIDLLNGNALIINYLIKRADTSSDGVSAPLRATLDHFVVEQTRLLLNPDFLNFADLSLQPGVCGLLLVLLKCVEQFSVPAWVERQVRDSIYALVKLINQVDYLEKEYAFFPRSVNLITNEYQRTNVLSWSEGDLGIALLIYRSARLFDDPILYKLADCIGTFTIIRNDKTSTAIESPWFLHGAAGTAALYGALYEVSKNTKYIQAQQHWLDVSLSMLPSDTSPTTLTNLLDGHLGILLCLHTFQKSCRDDWKGLFLL